MNRIESVDSIRLIAIISVITLHTVPFLSNTYKGDNYYLLGVIINQLARFAVPFFFIISGYFWGEKIRSGNDPFFVTKGMAVRISTILITWFCIHLFPYNNLFEIFEIGLIGLLKDTYCHALSLLQQPSILFFKGTKGLWFLIGLLYALFISFIFIKQKADKSLYIFALTLYVFGVLLKSYADTPIGISVDFNTRNGPFFSTILFSSGYFLSQYKPNERWFFYGLNIFLLGFFIHFVEIYNLIQLGTSFIQDYVFGTYFMGIGAAVLSLSNHKILRFGLLSDVGKMTLGIYAIHYVFVDLLKPIDKAVNSLVWEVGYVFAVLLLSIISIKILSISTTFRRIAL